MKDTSKFGSGSNLSSHTRSLTRKYIPAHSAEWELGYCHIIRNTVKYSVIPDNLMDLNYELWCYLLNLDISSGMFSFFQTSYVLH